MTKFVKITDSNGKSKRTRYINPAQVTIVDASGELHSLLHFANGKAVELNLPAKKIIAAFNAPVEAEPEEEF